MIDIQSFVSRRDSLRRVVSDLGWEWWGVSNFFLEDIPYTFSTGKIFASRLIQVLKVLVDSQKKKVDIVECGAGMGILAKTILDLVKDQDEALYKKLMFHVSEYSQEMISQFEKRQIFSEHRKHCQYEILDILNPEFGDEIECDLMIMSYLIDSLPARHIEVENGEIFEVLVRTRLSKDVKICDYSFCPPKVYDAKQIKALLLKGASQEKKRMMRQIISLLKEEWRRVPLDQTTMSDDEKKHLIAFVGQLKVTSKIRFNFPYEFGVSLEAILKKITSESGVVLYDFGYTDPNICPRYPHLLTEYGGAAFYCVYFPYIYWIANKVGIQHFSVDVKQGESQFVFLYKGDRFDQISRCLKKVFPNLGYEHEKDIVEKVKDISLDCSDYKPLIQKALQELSEDEKESYYLLLNCAKCCIDHGDGEYALEFIRDSLTCYEPVALPSYLLMAQAYSLQEKWGQAEEALVKVQSICFDYPFVFYERALMYGKQQKYEDYVNTPTVYLNYFDMNLIWNHLVTRALIYLELSKDDLAERVIIWILEAPQNYGFSVPVKVLNKVKMISERFVNKEIT